MTKKLVLGSFLAAIVLMVWGFITWALLSGQLGIVREVAAEDAVLTALGDSIPEDGVYFFPMAGYEDDQEGWKERHTRGPLGLLFFRAQGVAPSGSVMLFGFLHFWVSAWLAALLLKLCPLSEYSRRVQLVVLAATFAAVVVYVSPSIWWYVPWGYTLYAVLVTIVGWFLAGLVLAKFVAPE